jgi:hypothetical protein
MVSTAVSVHERTPIMNADAPSGFAAELVPATLLIRRRRPIAEPAGDATTLDGVAGAGRVILALTELGFGLGDIGQLIVDPDAAVAQIDKLDLGSTCPVVILGSHLVNRPEEAVRTALLGLAVRHLAPGGRLLIEHHPIDWAENAGPTPATPGAAPGMVDVVREPPFVSAVSVYDAGGRELRQPFTARVLSEAELADAVERVGLRITRRLGPTWVVGSLTA